VSEQVHSYCYGCISEPVRESKARTRIQPKSSKSHCFVLTFIYIYCHEQSKMTEERLPITPSKVMPLGNVIERSPRESTLESADQAAGIFSLYGEPSRDSWLSNSSDQATQTGRGSHPRTPLRNSITENELEEMDEENTTNGNGGGLNGNGVGDGDLSRSSITSQVPTPEIRLTPSKRQEQPGVHSNIARLSPSPRHPLGGSTTSNTSSMSTSRISSAGSSQYPGEEEDAFHVRSTCMSPILV
jgi:hypothetical protein